MTGTGALRLWVVETHPIQYKAPLFQALALDPRFDLTVLYAMLPDPEAQGTGFGRPFVWDVPLLEGYPWERMENRAAAPSVVRFGGCDTPEFYRRLKRGRPDAVLVNGWVSKCCLQALWACKRLGVPCLVRGEANLLRRRPWWKHLGHRLLVSQYRACLYIGVANHAFYRFHGCPEERLFFAPYGVDHASFTREAVRRDGQRAALRRDFGLPEAACVFLFAGKLEPKKQVPDLLRAVGRLAPAERALARVLVVGEGPLRPALEQSARELGVPVTFTGFLNQGRMPDAYAAADVLVLPSDAGETWGLVVNEAMASGRPAVVSRAAGCCQDLVVEGKTGHAFACGDSDGLATILRGYLGDVGLAQRQGREAARWVEGRGVAAVIAGLHAAMVSVVRQGRDGRDGQGGLA